MVQPDDVLDESLEHIMSADKQGRSEYEFTRQLLTAVLFSRYPERRTYARRVLDDVWECKVEIQTVEDESTAYAYFRFPPGTKYVLAARYSKTAPVFEEVPRPKDLEELRKFNSGAEDRGATPYSSGAR